LESFEYLTTVQRLKINESCSKVVLN